MVRLISFLLLLIRPEIAPDWWQVAGDPDLGRFTTPKQQPVDFAIWQAADGTWQLWSCIRNTSYPGKTRLFHRWQGARLTDTNWQPMGIAMLADPAFGETEGGLQAPFVIKVDGKYKMFYGGWEHIAIAESSDGKTFARQLTPEGKSGLFGEGPGANTRDPMVLRIRGLFHCYYTANPNKQGADYVRTSKDLRHWSPAKRITTPGGPYSAECPFVHFDKQSKTYYLFNTQRYGKDAHTSVYASRDPAHFEDLVTTLPIAAPEIVEYEGQLYIATLRGDLKGIQISKLSWK